MTTLNIEDVLKNALFYSQYPDGLVNQDSIDNPQIPYADYTNIPEIKILDYHIPECMGKTCESIGNQYICGC